MNADFQPNGDAPLAPSALVIPGQTYTYEGAKDFSMPRAMTKADMETVKQEFVQAARNALAAGMSSTSTEHHQCNASQQGSTASIARYPVTCEAPTIRGKVSQSPTCCMDGYLI